MKDESFKAANSLSDTLGFTPWKVLPSVTVSTDASDALSAWSASELPFPSICLSCLIAVNSMLTRAFTSAQAENLCELQVDLDLVISRMSISRFCTELRSFTPAVPSVRGMSVRNWLKCVGSSPGAAEPFRRKESKAAASGRWRICVNLSRSKLTISSPGTCLVLFM